MALSLRHSTAQPEAAKPAEPAPPRRRAGDRKTPAFFDNTKRILFGIAALVGALAGLLKACEKRPVSIAAIEGVADRVEAALQERPEKEMGTDEVGQIVMDELKRLDKVAYVRFASVYRSFRDVGEFMSELKDLLNAKE